MSSADITLLIQLSSDCSYTADLRFQSPDGAEFSSGMLPLALNAQALLELGHDADAYGRKLTATIFSAEAFKQTWKEARAYAHGAKAQLRVRLAIEHRAAELHSLRWETLRDPEFDIVLALSEQFVFSRTLISSTLPPVTIPPRPDLRALIVVANPSDLGTYELPAINVAGEVERITRALAPLPASIVGDPRQVVPCRATLPLLCHFLSGR